MPRNSSGRRRIETGAVRRGYDSRVSSVRRFGRHYDTGYSEHDGDLLPRLNSNIPRKKQLLASRIRTLALCSFLLVLFAVVSSRQKRRARRIAAFHNRLRHYPEPGMPQNSDRSTSRGYSAATNSAVSQKYHRAEIPGKVGNDLAPKRQIDGVGQTPVLPSEVGKGTLNVRERQSESSGELPEQIESFARNDMLSGARPVCRISNACILANGMVSLPMWMSKDDRLLRRCGVGPHTYHTGEKGPKGSPSKTIDADLAQLVRLMRFKEPSPTMVDFFSDSILHAAFLFDTISGATPSKSLQSHCMATKNSTECDQRIEDSGAAAHAAAAGVRPAIFVPKKLYEQSATWEAHAMEMFSGKYSSEPLTKVLVSDVTDAAEKGKTSNVSATCFRSLVTSDVKFKELPRDAFGVGSKYFSGHDIERKPRSAVPGTGETRSCAISVGILKKEGSRALKKVDELKQRISQIAGAALPSATVNVAVLENNKNVPFNDQVANAKNVDILVGGTSNSLSNMAFMKSGSSVFEIFPFGWQPPQYEQLARVMGHRYHSVYAGPQTTEFKTCIEHELFQLRKQNRLKADENPPWVKQVEDRWEAASGEFALSGKSPLLLNSDTTGVSNFHTRSCARHQSLEFNIDDIAKAVLLDARQLCHPA